MRIDVKCVWLSTSSALASAIPGTYLLLTKYLLTERMKSLRKKFIKYRAFKLGHEELVVFNQAGENRSQELGRILIHIQRRLGDITLELPLISGEVEDKFE